jgi:hypothetical protein
MDCIAWAAPRPGHENYMTVFAGFSSFQMDYRGGKTGIDRNE